MHRFRKSMICYNNCFAKWYISILIILGTIFFFLMKNDKINEKILAFLERNQGLIGTILIILFLILIYRIDFWDDGSKPFYIYPGEKTKK